MLAVLGRIKGLMVGIAVVGVCLLGVGVAASLDEEVLDRFVDSLQAGNLAEAGGRPAIRRKTVEYLIENPLVIVTGVGPFNYKYVTQRGNTPSTGTTTT